MESLERILTKFIYFKNFKLYYYDIKISVLHFANFIFIKKMLLKCGIWLFFNSIASRKPESQKPIIKHLIFELHTYLNSIEYTQ